MHVIWVAALTAAPLTTIAVAGWRRARILRRALRRERAAAGLTAAVLHRDFAVFQDRIQAAMDADAVLAAADEVLDTALEEYTATPHDPTDPQDGGSA
jgi:predicted short-subunit dehydrogenase-like oxidoreductase (DUF2520 family)